MLKKGEPMKVFLSHISGETPLAFVIKEWVENTFLGQEEVFVSSDIKDYPAVKSGLKKLTPLSKACKSFSFYAASFLSIDPGLISKQVVLGSKIFQFCHFVTRGNQREHFHHQSPNFKP